MENNQDYVEVDGKKITKEEFENLQQNSNIKLKPLKEGVFKTLKKLFG